MKEGNYCDCCMKLIGKCRPVSDTVTDLCLLSAAAWVWEEKEGGGQKSESRQTAGVGHVVLCLWEAPVLQHQRPGGYHQTAGGKHPRFRLLVIIVKKKATMAPIIQNKYLYYLKNHHECFFFQVYLKEILRDIGVYNVKGTHKNTWELRPEYRHYQGEEKTDE